MRTSLLAVNRWFAMLLFDPIEVVAKMRGAPHYLRNWRRYRRANRDRTFVIAVRDLWYKSYDRFDTAGQAHGHYFFQDLWAARQLCDAGVKEHVDVGSRLDGFVAHVLPFCRVTYVDIRPLSLDEPGFSFRQGSIVDLPFADNSVRSLSCLHVIEHIGLGRYGDPDGHLRGARELVRVLAPGGRLLLATPVGRQRVCFDAHRVFASATVISMFAGVRLVEFSLVDDVGRMVHRNASFSAADACDYGCGLFVFEKQELS